MSERKSHENDGRSTQRKETRNANELLRRDVKIKKTHGIPDVPEQNKNHKNMERVQQGDTTKEMRIIRKK